MGSIIVAQIGGILATQVCIVFRAHIAAAAPGLIADAPIFHMPGFFPAVFLPLTAHGSAAVRIAVLHPIAEFLHCTASDVAGKIRFAAQLATQLHEFMGAEMIVFGHATPVGVDNGFALLFGADTIFPVIGICKTATGPTQNRYIQFLQRIHHVGSHSIEIRNFRILANIQSAIDASTQMLREMAVDVLIDGSFGSMSVYNYFHNPQASFFKIRTMFTALR